jgi:uncharacterized protein YcnI
VTFMNKTILGILGAFISLSISSMPAYAHVVVVPKTVNVGAFQTFTVGVPNEKEIPTTGVKLIIPEGLMHVTPTVKAGWTITMKESGDEGKVVEIDWIGGSIPEGQRDDFSFSAQAPANETTLIWKAYQTYQNGEVVAWDQDSSSNNHDGEVNPYSTTVITNDAAIKMNEDAVDKREVKTDIVWQGLTMLALLLSVVAIGMQLRKKV